MGQDIRDLVSSLQSLTEEMKGKGQVGHSDKDEDESSDMRPSEKLDLEA